MSDLRECTRLYTRRGRVAHLRPPWAGTVLCPVRLDCIDYWLGTGSQEEYDRAAELETCSRCLREFMGSRKKI